MRADGDSHNITMCFAAAFMVIADHEQTSVIRPGRRCWVQAAGIESRDLAQVFTQFMMICV